MAVEEKDTFRLLIASDLHLGYMEKNGFLAADSFNALEEILQIAIIEDVHMVLVAGDFFHDAAPTSGTILKTIRVLKKYVWGNKKPAFQVLSRGTCSKLNTDNGFAKISLPIFTIHGCHDEPVGRQKVSGIDILHSAELINYIGKTDTNSRHVKPLVFKKGETYLALYPLSHIADHKMSKMATADRKKIEIEKITSDKDLFNILLLHQSRQPGKNGLANECIPEFIDVAVWGHDHACKIDMETVRSTAICQPGSTVRTHLNEDEVEQKHVGILHVNRQSFCLKKVPLTLVRPFIYEKLQLDMPEDVKVCDLGDRRFEKDSIETVINKIESILQQVRNDNGESVVPLIHLDVYHYIPEQIFNTKHISNHFQNRVANVNSMINWEQVFVPKIKTEEGTADLSDIAKKKNKNLMTFVDEALVTTEGVKLELLTKENLNVAVDKFTNANYVQAFEDYVDDETDKAKKSLIKTEMSTDEIIGQIKVLETGHKSK